MGEPATDCLRGGGSRGGGDTVGRREVQLGEEGGEKKVREEHVR